MEHLFTAAGEAALAQAMARKPLLAFDFDGTLAPIVARPRDARIPRTVSERLARLGEHWPVAIVSGRALADVRSRLGFVPRYVIGSHGAEEAEGEAATEVLARRLDALRERLAMARSALAGAGVEVEDKGPSLALHYRRARDRAGALALIRTLLSPPDPGLHVFAGKKVENVVPAGAPDKSAAVHALVARSGADCAVFAGDDVNDEPVFAAAAPGWVTVRVGRQGAASTARFFVEGPGEIAKLLEKLLAYTHHDHAARRSAGNASAHSGSKGNIGSSV